MRMSCHRERREGLEGPQGLAGAGLLWLYMAAVSLLLIAWSVERGASGVGRGAWIEHRLQAYHLQKFPSFTLWLTYPKHEFAPAGRRV
jgi:hypothetical protein